MSETHLEGYPLELVQRFPKLRALFLRCCNISQLKSSLYCQLGELRNLSLEDNNISEMNCFHFSMFPVIQVLNLNGNNLRELTLADCDFEEPLITQLHLAMNDFDEVPKIAFQLAKPGFEIRG